MKDLILKPLCYFDIFDHPLKKEELIQLIGFKMNSSDLELTLQELVNEAFCFEFDAYYSINPNIESQVKGRLEKEILAKSYIKKLPFYARIIKSFPFVRAVSISGSLSKGVMYKDGDIDYFIITKKNRLWICRSLLVAFKKIFLLNSRKYFCINYFVDEDNLEIIDKNIFTAIEVSHLIPVYNSAIVQKMKHQNKWIENYFPNHLSKNLIPPIEDHGKLKPIIEKVFFEKFADKLDFFLMGITFNRWRKKFKNFDTEKLELTMRSNRGISKHHPSDYQTKVLAAYEERIAKFKLLHEGIIYT